VLPILSTYLPLLLGIMSTSGYGGFTLFLSLTRDTLSLLTLHLRVCHEITSILVRWQLSSLSGLWNLFRGTLIEVGVSLIDREEVECPSTTNRFIYLRRRPAISRDTFVHRIRFPSADSGHLCGIIRFCTLFCTRALGK